MRIKDKMSKIEVESKRGKLLEIHLFSYVGKIAGMDFPEGVNNYYEDPNGITKVF